jgi:hypothetical protein
MKYSICLLLLVCFSFISDNKFDDLTINQIQVIGSHNSYKQAIDPALFSFLQSRDSARMSKIQYSHISLTDQLNLGLLNLEIDIYADSKGGKYAHPKGLDWVPNQAPYDTAKVMNEPGFKVFHIQDIDFRSNCLTFKNCLQELKKWSEAHPDHYPVFITMNTKDQKISLAGFNVPEKFSPEIFDSLDHVITQYLGVNHLITPDMVRGKYETLNTAVLHSNWPKLKDSKGKFIFILDENGDNRTMYLANHPSLKNRVLFADAEAGTPESAILIKNNAKSDLTLISNLVKQGYIIRTRADGDTDEARKNDKSSFEAAKISGAQIITTDYYQKSSFFNSDYIVYFENGNKYLRVNTLLQPKDK